MAAQQTNAPITTASPASDLKPPLHCWKFDVVSPDQSSPDTGGATDKIPASLTQVALVPGKFGQAADFPVNGTVTMKIHGQPVDVPANVGSVVTIPLRLATLDNPGFTVSFWIKGKRAKEGYVTILDAGGKKGLEISVNNMAQLRVNTGNVWSALNSPPHQSAISDQWTQIVLTYGQNHATLYLNGVLADSQDVAPASFADQITLGGYLEIPQSGDPTPKLKGGFIGDVDDLLVFDDILAADQVAALFKATPTPQ